MMKRLSVIIFLIFFIVTPLYINAQDYQTAMSLRSGVSSGVSIQFFRDESKAIEGLLSFRNNGLQLTVIKEYYRPVLLKRSTHIFAFYGWGGHLGFEWNNTDHHHDFPPRVFSSGPSAGLDAMAGAEYRFYKVPVTIGLNFKPFAEISATRFFNLNLWDYGFTVKYTFKTKH
jgi:hypothetical protein